MTTDVILALSRTEDPSLTCCCRDRCVFLQGFEPRVTNEWGFDGEIRVCRYGYFKLPESRSPAYGGTGSAVRCEHSECHIDSLLWFFSRYISCDKSSKVL